jgi:hypothetical protein
MAKQPTNGKPKPAPDPLPDSLVAALPTARHIVNYVYAIDELVPALEQELTEAKNKGAVDLARSFVTLHRLMAVVSQKLDRLDKLFALYKTKECPAVLEAAGVTHIPLTEGYRVGISYLTRASILAGQKEEAYKWLIDNGHGDIIIETVNSSTLSALASHLQEEENLTLPESLFNTALMTNTSVTKT